MTAVLFIVAAFVFLNGVYWWVYVYQPPSPPDRRYRAKVPAGFRDDAKRLAREARRRAERTLDGVAVAAERPPNPVNPAREER